MMRLYDPTAGRVIFEGKDITRMRERQLRFVRRKMQMIFQDPADSMNARLTVGYIIEEPLLIQTRMSAAARREKALALLRDVGLAEESYDRYPHEFSGGQRQRIAIARALAIEPEIVICDEPVSALDVSVQSQILNLLLEMQKEHALTMIFVSHALSVVRHMSDRVAVMYLGSVMELADSRTIYENPAAPVHEGPHRRHPAHRPRRAQGRTASLTGEVPSPLNLPPGCPFYSNCPIHVDLCLKEKPALRLLARRPFLRLPPRVASRRSSRRAGAARAPHRPGLHGHSIRNPFFRASSRTEVRMAWSSVSAGAAVFHRIRDELAPLLVGGVDLLLKLGPSSRRAP